MTIAVANVDQTTDTFGQWVSKTNILADALSTKIVTTNSNTTTGNAAISGAFTSNTLYTKVITGGNSSTTANISFGSNVYLSTNVTFASGRFDLGLSSNVYILGGNSTYRVMTVNAITNSISIGKLLVSDIADISVTSPSNGSILTYTTTGTQWVNSNLINVNIGTNTVTVSANLVATGLVYSNGFPVWTSNTFVPSSKLNVTGGTITGNLAITGVLTVNGASINSTTFSGTANNATYFNGQLATYYTNITARLGYTPVNKAGDTMTGNLVINNSAPVITMQDTDHRSGGIHVNNNTFYVLRGDNINSTTFAQFNSEWPLTLNLDNNDMRVGGNFYGRNIYPVANGSFDIGASGSRYGTVWGNAISSNWADLAERYEADEVLEPGTVVEIGGNKEITATTSYCSLKIAGVISTQPGLKMNDSGQDDSLNPFVALKGRVPCYVVGPVMKGDTIVSSETKGCGRAYTEYKRDLTSLAIVGISLVNDLRTERRLIEIKV